MELSATPAFGALKLAIWRILEAEVMRARSEMETEMDTETER
jgi:hypothetical protein